MLDTILLLSTNDKSRANWEESASAVYPYKKDEKHFYDMNNKIYETVKKYIEINNTPYLSLGHYNGGIQQEDFYYIKINSVEKTDNSFIFNYTSLRCSNKSSKSLLKLKDHPNLLISLVTINRIDTLVKRELWGEIVFLGSSSESKDVAIKVGKVLQEKYKNKIILKPWWDMFDSKDITILKLIEIAKTVDKAIFILSDDDTVESRNTTKHAPRDNVIFEYGLFLGVLGINNVDICCKEGIKLPTDISGFTCIHYKGDISNDFNALDKLYKLY